MRAVINRYTPGLEKPNTFAAYLRTSSSSVPAHENSRTSEVNAVLLMPPNT